jgi:kynurenine formamidase
MCLPGTPMTLAAVAPPPTPRRDSPLTQLVDEIKDSLARVRRHVATPRRAITLTHTYRAGFPVSVYEPPSCFPLLRRDVEGYYSQGWTIQEHSGTHIDMPAHFYERGRTAPELRPDELLLPAVVLNVTTRVADEPNTLLDLDDVRTFEREHGRIPRHAAVLMDSGWQTRARDAARFTNADADGTFASPGFHPDAVRFLIDERQVACIGVDTLSLDCGSSTTYPAHQAALSADRFGIEALANLDKIPPRGATITIGLVPFEHGSGGPCHVLARW